MTDPRRIRLFKSKLTQVGFLMAWMSSGWTLLGGEPDPARLSPIVKATQVADPAVVNIQGHKTIRTETVSYSGESATQQVNGMGSGVIIDPRGFILTNLHVVEGVADIDVTLANGKKFAGRMIDHDPQTDLALIKVNSDEPLPVIKTGTSSDLLIGETVIAIGNPFGYSSTVTVGIVSQLHRNIPVNGTQEYRNLIQTDASINPGNSGGPLINILGDMIGVNVAVRMGANGIGFAIPVDEALEVASTMIERQRAQRQELAMKVVYDVSKGLVIKSVEKDSAAEKAGFKVGDKIVSIGGKEVSRRVDYELALYDVPPETTLDIAVQRDGAMIEDLCMTVVALKKVPESDTVMERAWQVLGIKATPVDQNEVSRIDSNYHGGMRVTSVRAGSPAAKAGIRNGDILVGILTYETTSPTDLAWILDSKDLRSNQGAKFYVVRDRETLFGSLRVASAPSRPVR
jgi:serine protease Do